MTIKIKTEHVKAWGKVFKEKCGSPVDISEAQNTKQWRLPYKLDDESSGVIKVKIWDLVHKEKSTMLIQGEHLKQYLNISFAEKVIPKAMTGRKIVEVSEKDELLGEIKECVKTVNWEKLF